MNKFENPSDEPMKDGEEGMEEEVNPELKKEEEAFEEGVEEITNEVDDIDWEQADEEDVKKVADKTKLILDAIGMAAGAGAMLTAAFMESGESVPAWEQVAKPLLLTGGFGAWIYFGPKFNQAWEKLGGTWERVRDAFREKESTKRE